MKIKQFLKKPENSHTREALLTSRLAYDLKLAAVLAGYDLGIFFPDVDRDGYDIIFDDYDSIRKVQIKSILDSSKTSNWDIHKSIIRPARDVCERLGYEASPTGTGQQGAVILMQATPNNTKLEISYFYTDVFIIEALSLKIIDKKPSIEQSVIDKFHKEIRNGVSQKKINIKKSLFVKAKSASHLLALMSLHSEYNHLWQNNLLKVSENKYFRDVSNLDVYHKAANQELLELATNIK